MSKLSKISQSTIFTAKSMEYCGDVRISNNEQEYYFQFTNHLLPYEFKVSKIELLSYTQSLIDDIQYATSLGRIQDFIEVEASWNRNPSAEYVFCRFANDILEDYWDVVEASLISGEYVPEVLHLKVAA
ncbi:hypothetical protein WAE58_21520 [Pedobacter panaciterrae]|uniref:Uncharacterized protein n=1 Tax=Pedobacter panaciterrae TaxID=363849 RepID=A0ABU8NRZ7_9SPHI